MVGNLVFTATANFMRRENPDNKVFTPFLAGRFDAFRATQNFANPPEFPAALRKEAERVGSGPLPLPDAIESLRTGRGRIGQRQETAVASEQRQGRPIGIRKRVLEFEGIYPTAPAW